MGNVPSSATEQDVSQLFSRVLSAAGATEAPGSAVLSTFVNSDKHFAFVELRTPTEAANALAFEGLCLHGNQLSMRRPHEFNLLEVRRHTPDLSYSRNT